jgi:hypothetical protein
MAEDDESSKPACCLVETLFPSMGADSVGDD